MATGPNQVWSWDITKLLGPVKWVYFYLYVILDIFSRYVVGWMVAERENSKLDEHLIAETCRKHGVVTGQLKIHSERFVNGPLRYHVPASEVWINPPELRSTLEIAPGVPSSTLSDPEGPLVFNTYGDSYVDVVPVRAALTLQVGS